MTHLNLTDIKNIERKDIKYNSINNNAFANKIKKLNKNNIPVIRKIKLNFNMSNIDNDIKEDKEKKLGTKTNEEENNLNNYDEIQTLNL